MGIATMVEKIYGREYACKTIYGSWWFVGLWMSMSLISLIYLVWRRVYRRLVILLLHLSFLLILIGAFVTHLTSEEGTVYLRKGVLETSFSNSRGESSRFPFALSLSEFNVVYYSGTDAVMDYQATIMVNNRGEKETIQVSMNHIGKVSGYRLYQSSYDSDYGGVTLLVSHDPYGIPITYAGYLMLLVSLLWTLFSRHTCIRQLYRMATKTVLLLIIVLCHSPEVMAQERAKTISRELAGEVGSIPILYNERICPLNTAAMDFVKKLCGKSCWNGLSADEIFVGWMIFYTEWESQPVIKIKNREVQHILGITGEWASVRDFYTSQHEYKLHDRINDSSLSENTRKALIEADEKIQMITMFYNSEMLRMFPLRVGENLHWHVPGSTELPRDVSESEFQFVNHAMDNLVKYLLVENVEGTKRMIAKIKLYQKEKAGKTIPSSGAIKAEIFYNKATSANITIYLLLTLGIVFGILSLVVEPHRWCDRIHVFVIVCMLVYITLLLMLRWWISGHVPLSNGYETMLFLAWTMMVLTMVLMSRVPIVKTFGPVIASLFLLVSSFDMGNPQIAHLRPVLLSPLLSFHVAIIMISYSLLAFITFIAAYCLCTRNYRRQLTSLSRLMLYPAVACLCIGIFIGAVWANISWGTYWSWDPKETWALITLMIYAVPLHRTSLVEDNHPRRYHVYVLVSFMAVVITYFGVNYYMSGMHSYA